MEPKTSALVFIKTDREIINVCHSLWMSLIWLFGYNTKLSPRGTYTQSSLPLAQIKILSCCDKISGHWIQDRFQYNKRINWLCCARINTHPANQLITRSVPRSYIISLFICAYLGEKYKKSTLLLRVWLLWWRAAWQLTNSCDHLGWLRGCDSNCRTQSQLPMPPRPPLPALVTNNVCIDYEWLTWWIMAQRNSDFQSPTSTMNNYIFAASLWISLLAYREHWGDVSIK